MSWWEPLAAYWSRKRLERLCTEQAIRLIESQPAAAIEDDDADRWQLLSTTKATVDQTSTRDKARLLAERNPFARNALMLYRHYVVGTGMQHEVVPCPTGSCSPDAAIPHDSTVIAQAGQLWRAFLTANQWDTGNRRDWEFCQRTWRDGECFLRLFRQSAWPPRVHFVDPERIASDPVTGLPDEGIATQEHNVEVPLAYRVQLDESRFEMVPADRMLHCKIGVDANVKRGLSILTTAIDALQKYQSWLDVELIHRKVASSIVLIRKHTGNHHAGGVPGFADWAAAGSPTPGPLTPQQRRALLQPGTMIDTQGYDLQYLSPDSHFDDASILGRRLLLAVAAGTGLPEFMLTADAANANYSSTLVAEGPAVRLFASWQAFFIGQWQALFRLVMQEAVRLMLLPANALPYLHVTITPPAVAVRKRKEEAEADAIYFDRGALSRRELARRDRVDPSTMEREKQEESNFPSPLTPLP